MYVKRLKTGAPAERLVHLMEQGLAPLSFTGDALSDAQRDNVNPAEGCWLQRAVRRSHHLDGTRFFSVHCWVIDQTSQT
jgi:hypothetical protein